MRKVGGSLVCFPRWPHFHGKVFGLPVISWARIVIGGKDSHGGNGKELVVHHGELGMREFALCGLKH